MQAPLLRHLTTSSRVSNSIEKNGISIVQEHLLNAEDFTRCRVHLWDDLACLWVAVDNVEDRLVEPKPLLDDGNLRVGEIGNVD